MALNHRSMTSDRFPSSAALCATDHKLARASRTPNCIGCASVPSLSALTENRSPQNCSQPRPFSPSGYHPRARSDDCDKSFGGYRSASVRRILPGASTFMESPKLYLRSCANLGLGICTSLRQLLGPNAPIGAVNQSEAFELRQDRFV